VRSRYPFEALHWLRQQRVERGARVLGESAQRAARARGDAERAELARRNTEQRIAALAAAEQARLNEGLMRVGDLALVADWQRGASAELASKAEHESRARAAHATEAAAETVARRALSVASNEAKLLDAHRDGFRARCAAEQELGEEEAAAEQWTAGHFPSRRG
jgi:hypothetical protein